MLGQVGPALLDLVAGGALAKASRYVLLFVSLLGGSFRGLGFGSSWYYYVTVLNRDYSTSPL